MGHLPRYRGGSRVFGDILGPFMGQNIYVNMNGRRKRIVNWKNGSTGTSRPSRKCGIFSMRSPKGFSPTPIQSPALGPSPGAERAKGHANRGLPNYMERNQFTHIRPSHLRVIHFRPWQQKRKIKRDPRLNLQKRYEAAQPKPNVAERRQRNMPLEHESLQRQRLSKVRSAHQ